MAIRLLVLSNLASSWNSLLRRCIYHVFETAGLVPSCVDYASYCIESVTTALSLESGHALFRLFAPQLLFTWLEKREIASIPYAVFNYTSLGHLLRDVQDEATAQVVMRSTDEELESLCQKLGKTKEVILQHGFGKVAAYSLAYDTDNKGSNSTKTTSEGRARAILGGELYARLFRNHYPRIISILIQSINGDGSNSLIKMLSKDPLTKSPASTLTSIIKLGASVKTLPADQQPCFHPFVSVPKT